MRALAMVSSRCNRARNKTENGSRLTQRHRFWTANAEEDLAFVRTRSFLGGWRMRIKRESEIPKAVSVALFSTVHDEARFLPFLTISRNRMLYQDVSLTRHRVAAGLHSSALSIDVTCATLSLLRFSANADPTPPRNLHLARGNLLDNVLKHQRHPRIRCHETKHRGLHLRHTFRMCECGVRTDKRVAPQNNTVT